MRLHVISIKVPPAAALLPGNSFTQWFFVVIALLTGCTQPPQKEPHAGYGGADKGSSYKVTFIELGSVRCHSCVKMMKVMEAVEKKYGDEVQVIFYDVLKPEGKPFAKQYHINLIPTQVFLDAQGKEFFRHQGYLPKNEVFKILRQKGVRRNFMNI